MKEEYIECLDFIYHKTKPTVQKDGNKYEIITIEPIDDESIEMSAVKVYPGYEHKLTYLTVDNTWRKSSINHIKDIVSNEINRIKEYEENQI